MGLKYNDSGSLTYVNLKNGKLFTREKDKEPVFFTDLEDVVLVKATFVIEEYKGKKYELAKLVLEGDKNDRYCLQMRSDSGYFRAFCNSLKTGDIKKPITITPNFQNKNDKPVTTIFIKQDGIALKHAYTLKNMGDLPALKKTEFKDEILYDSTDQIDFWKKWLTESLQPVTTSSSTETTTERKNYFEQNQVPQTDDLPF